MPWLLRQLLAPRDSAVGVRHRLVDTELRGAERRRRLADAVLVHEVLCQFEPAVDAAEHRVGADADVRQRDLGMVGRHVERPPEELDLETRRVGRDEKGADPLRVAGVAGLVRAKMMSWVAWCSPVFHRFIPLSTHSSPSRTAVVSM